MMTRAYATSLSDGWSAPSLEIVSVPSQYVGTYSLDELVGRLELVAPPLLREFGHPEEVRDFLRDHFSTVGLADQVSELFNREVIVVEESPSRTATLYAAVAGAGAIAAGFTPFGPLAIIAVPAGVFLLAAAPSAGQGFGDWVGAWFRSRIPKIGPR